MNQKVRQKSVFDESFVSDSNIIAQMMKQKYSNEIYS